MPSLVSSTSQPARPSLWQNRNYVILFLSGVLLTVGGKVYELALPLILYTLSHHSAIVMTTMRAIEFLPNLLLALFIGVWVDRTNKKRFTLYVIAGQVGLLLLLFALYLFGTERLWIYYVTGFGLMTLQYGYGNARFAIVKYALPRELLTAANANFSFVSTFVTIIGPAISGFLLMLTNLHNGLLVTAVAYIVSLLVLSRLPSSESTGRGQQKSSFWADLGEGWVALRTNHALWQITMLVIFLNAAAGMVDAISVFFAKDHLHLSTAMVGVILGAEGFGGLVGSRLVAWSRRTFGSGGALGLTILGLAICDVIPVFSNHVWPFALALFGIGFFSTIESVIIWTFRQETTPPELIGRVSGLTGSIFKLGMVWTILGSGWLATLAGTWTVYLAAGIGNLVMFVIFTRLPLRKLA